MGSMGRKTIATHLLPLAHHVPKMDDHKEILLLFFSLLNNFCMLHCRGFGETEIFSNNKNFLIYGNTVLFVQCL